MTPQQQECVQELVAHTRRQAEALRQRAPFLTEYVSVFLAGFEDSDSILSAIKPEFLQSVFERFVFTQNAVDAVITFAKRQGRTVYFHDKRISVRVDDCETVKQLAICFALMEREVCWCVTSADVCNAVRLLETARLREAEGSDGGQVCPAA